MSKLDVLTCFSGPEGLRIERTLEHVLPHLEPDDFAVVGGLAIRYLLAAHGRPYSERPINDIDLVVRHRESVKPTVAQDFLISHFHQDSGGPYWAIVDPTTKLKLDIFHWPAAEPTLTTVQCGQLLIPMHSAEDQLAKTIADTTKVLRGEMVDPKQFDDAESLTFVADPDRTSQVFAAIYGQRLPNLADAQEAFALAKQVAAERSELVVHKPYHRQPYHCQHCVQNSDYPLTPLHKIYDILQYVE